MKTNYNSEDLIIEIARIKKAVVVLRAINHELRVKMLSLIHKMQRITVTDIQIIIGLEQSVTSQHLAKLRKTGFVNTEKNGIYIFYSINYLRLKRVNELVKDLSDLTNSTDKGKFNNTDT